MADRKDPANRARRNKDLKQKTELVFVHARAPKLPPLGKGQKWNPQTIKWWGIWRASSQSVAFMATDWQFLLITARLHHAVSEGNLSLAAELRLREAKFGATVEDRANLRMVFAESTMAEISAAKKVKEANALAAKEGKSQNTTYPELRAVDDAVPA